MNGEIILTVQNGLLAGNKYEFRDRQTCIVGRAEDCDIRLPRGAYPDLSRHHALLAIDPPHVSVRDLGSRNGTRVNGVLIGQRAAESPPQADEGGPDLRSALLDRFQLCDGDELAVGGIFFRIHISAPSPGLPAPVGPAAPTVRKPPISGAPLALDARTAADLMTAPVVSVPASATLEEAEVLLRDRGLSAVPVVGEGGEAVGVLSRADVIAFACEESGHAAPLPETSTDRASKGSRVLQIADVGPAQVQDVMTRVVFSVGPQTPAAKVVDTLLNLRIHRLFVTDPAGNIVGVVSMTDVLRHLHRAAEVPAARA
jgi:CBS domain-containing protein